MSSCEDTGVINDADNQNNTYDVSGEHDEAGIDVSGKQGQTSNDPSPIDYAFAELNTVLAVTVKNFHLFWV